jgi:hypothetical protein
MRIDRPAILRHVQFLKDPEVMQRARSLLLKEDAWSVGENLPPVKVEDILRLWRIRRKNAEITKHRILGIDLLIDSLARLPLGLDLSLFGFSSERQPVFSSLPPTLWILLGLLYQPSWKPPSKSGYDFCLL